MTSGGGDGAPLGGSTAGSGGAVGYMHAAATISATHASHDDSLLRKIAFWDQFASATLQQRRQNVQQQWQSHFGNVQDLLGTGLRVTWGQAHTTGPGERAGA